MIIEPQHFEYLVIQHGSISNRRHNPQEWKTAYEKSLGDLYRNIAPVLPPVVHNLLDVGSGLGGIDVFLSQHYEAYAPEIVLLDGVDNPPQVEWHDKPFSHFRVATDFLGKNGVANIDCIEAGKPWPKRTDKFDLAVSFAAYGFHIHPGNYLEDLKQHIHDKTVLIFDVRRTKKEWLRLLVEAFGPPKTLFQAEKFVRLAFRA